MEVKNPNRLPTIPIANLLPTQGELKNLTEINYKKLKNNIIRRGFDIPVYVWENDKGILHLLDGHQRQRVLTTEGWNEPIPYLKVPAKDLQEAMARLLEITSQYGTITQEGIDAFIAKYELPEAEVYEATSFDAIFQYSDGGNDDEDGDELSDDYSQKLGTVEYEPKDTDHKTSDLYSFDESIYNKFELVQDPDLRRMLTLRSAFFTNFNFSKIADYYAYQATDDEKLAIESLGLVLLDKDGLMANGFADLIEQLEDSEYEVGEKSDE